ncbi:uncharacterized protein E1O_04780 [Burkholderiales bacterium GJ-E10]|nr:uncharacterized protein E1O_04780 [Burkholderiales bacterium GJ-E10]
MIALTAMNAAFTILSVAGNEFIKRRNRRGYWFWLAGNAIGLAMFALQRQWITAALYVYFAASCLQGLRHWGRLERKA